MSFSHLDTKTKLLLPLFIPIFLLDFLIGLFQQITNKAEEESKNKSNNKDDDADKKKSSSSLKTKMQSVAYGSSTDKHGTPRRTPGIEEFNSIMSNGATTVYEMIQYGIEQFTDNIAMQHYEFIELKKLKETDRFPTKIFSDNLIQVTYKELGTKIINFGKGLRELGMEPQPPSQTTTSSNKKSFDETKGKFTLVIFEDTCKEWTISMHGALSQSMVVATCYATLGEDAVIAAVNETEATSLMVNWKNIEKFYKLKDRMPTLTTIIASTNEYNINDDKTSIWKPEGGDGEGGGFLGIGGSKKVQVVSYDDVIEIGSKNNTIEPKPPKPSDVAVIMYTSGSTGKPKGVVMRHSHLVAGLAGMIQNVTLRPGREVYVSYLPLAHILALQVENGLLGVGSTLCYTDPRNMAKQMPKFKPTIFAGVPKVWELLQNGLQKQLSKGPKPISMIFNIFLEYKIAMLKAELETPIANDFFGLITTKIFGNKRIEFGVSGGGPMSESLQLFCRAVFNCPIIQGYALTETCVGGCFQSTADQRPGVVGPPVPCVEVMLQSEPDINDSEGFPYLATDKKGARGEDVIGRGEICFRGPCISGGYYKLPEKTKEDFDEDGFFHTGDIGQFTADGCIQIVDRKKNLVKLKGGEYVAIEAMETAFATSKYVSMICVIANGDLDGPLAVVIANKDELQNWADSYGIEYESIDKLADTDQARKEVVKSFKVAGAEAGLGKLEMRIKDCALITNSEWGPGHGMTASMKLDRKQVLKLHEKEIDAMYKRNGVNV